MINRSIRYITISDIHLGHPRNKTEDILNALEIFFDNFKARSDLDILFLAGDVFDQLLDFPTNEVSEITIWITRLMEYCQRNKIKLRVLEGTPSHDWKQSNVFMTMKKSMPNPPDIKYIDTLHIEYVDDLDINILYVPDEYDASTDKTFKEVKELMKSRNIDKVDISIMHGSFTYQLPVQAVKVPKHNERNYLDITKFFISIGHIHTFSVYERIIAQGSFDRLAHGEEEPKGGVECIIHPDGTGEYFFIENKLAKTFKTIKLKFPDLDRSIDQINKVVNKLKKDSFVRIKASKTHPVIIGFDEIKKQYPLFNFSKLTLEDEKEQSNQLIDDNEIDTYTPITLNEDNITKIVLESLQHNQEITSRQLLIAETVMKEVT